MTVESTTTRAQYSTNGTTGPWTIPFYFLANTDVLVVYTNSSGTETTLVHGTTCTVSGAGVQAGGSVTTATAYAAGGTITVTRSPALLQSSNYNNNDRFPATTVESDLDRGIMVDQYINERVDRTLRLPVGTTGTVSELPVASARASKVLTFDSNGNPVCTTPSEGTAGALAADLIATSTATKGAGMSGYDRVNAYAADTVGRKLRETISADEFGVVADSAAAAAANATALTAALADAATSTKHVILASGGTYYFPTTFSLGVAGVTLDGRGATIKQESGAQTGDWLSITGCNGFKLRNVTIDGNRVGAPSLGADKSLLLVHNVEDVDIENVTVHGSSGKGLSITSGVAGSGTRNIRCSNVTAYDCAKQAVMTDRSNGGTENPACEKIILDRIFVTDTDHAGIAINDGSRQVVLSNSILDVNNTTWDALAIRGSREVTVTNCIGRRGRNGCQVSVLDAAALARGEDSRNIVFSGNVWDQNDQGGLLIAGVINMTVTGDIARNNNQGVAGSGINITQVAGVRRSSYITLSSPSAIDDQTVATQVSAISVAASDVVRINAPVMFGNTTDNRVKLTAGVTGVRVTADGDDGATTKQVSGTTGSISAASTAVVTLNFTTAFDTLPANWSVASVFVGSSTNYLRVNQIVAVTTAAIQVLVENVHATLAQTGTLMAEVRCVQ